MKGFLGVTKILVPQFAVDETMAFLRRQGMQGLEAFSLWAGVADNDIFRVKVNIIPAQVGRISENGVSVSVGPEELHRLNVWLYENKMSLIAQIHSHPSDAYHSDTDDTFPIATTVGCVSIVIPDFARQAFSISRCAIYRLDTSNHWTYLDGTDPVNLIKIVDP